MSIAIAHPSLAVGLLNQSAIGPEAGLNWSDLYEAEIDAWYQPQYNVTQLITTGTCTASAPCLWVPWFGSSSSCLATGESAGGNLKDGTSCNSGDTIDSLHNCMVTDEFSQLMINLANGQNQTAFQHGFNTINVINSSFGRIPAWRIYRNNDSIEQCRSGVNGNCDTASDATARIIIALYSAANNSFFPNATQKQQYYDLAVNLSAAMLTYEIQNSCKNSTLGSGTICYWLKAGKQATLTTTDGSYTGYYADAMIAMEQACANTRNLTYCAVAGNLSLNYLQAAKYNGSAFRAPPGRSFKWDNFSTATVPYANCTNTCGNSAIDGDETWDGADAIRAFFSGLAKYVDTILVQRNALANMSQYMNYWTTDKMIGNLNSLPVQFYPNGNNSGSNQSGYKVQGLQAAGLIGQNNSTQVNTTLYNAHNHFSASTYKWDNAACPGIYDQSFSVRMLGVAMGRDQLSFPSFTGSNGSGNSSNTSNTSISWTQNLTNMSQNWNTTFYLDANASDSSDCTVDSYLSNNTHFPINRTTGVITWTANISKVGNYTLTISVNDSCTHNISQTLQVNITYHPISILNVSISPSSTNGSENLTCNISVNNTDGGMNTTLINWFRNGTLQASLQNKTVVLAPGNFSYGDVWICSARINDTITTTAFSNSTSVLITDNSTSNQTDNSTSGGSTGGGGGGGGGAAVSQPNTSGNQTNLTSTSTAPALSEESLLEEMKIPLLFFGVFIALFIASGVILAT